MAIKTKNTVNFSEIFEFAEKKHKVTWNHANDLFFHTILDYKGFNDFELAELEWGIKEDYKKENDARLARIIMIDFMKENKVKNLTVESK
jgi:hypothetical protein